MATTTRGRLERASNSAHPEGDRVAVPLRLLPVAGAVARRGHDPVAAALQVDPLVELPLPRALGTEQDPPLAAPRLGEAAVALEEAAALVAREPGQRDRDAAEPVLAALVLRGAAHADPASG